jgi:hypothetical protein
MMLTVLDGHPNAAVDETAVAAMDTVLDRDDPPYWAADAMALTLRRLGRSPPPEAARPPGGDQSAITRDPLLGGLHIDGPALHRRWTSERTRIPFARRTLPPQPNSGVPRTGATTPP